MEDLRFKEIDSRLDKVEDQQQKFGADLKRHELEFAETKVYVKEIYKKMDSISLALEGIRTASSKKTERLSEKAFFLIIGAVVAFIASKIQF